MAGRNDVPDRVSAPVAKGSRTEGGQSLHAAEKSQDYTAHSESTAPTQEQLEEAVEFLHTVLEIGAPQNEWEQNAVQRILTVLEKAVEVGRSRPQEDQQPVPPEETEERQPVPPEETEEQRPVMDSRGGKALVRAADGAGESFDDPVEELLKETENPPEKQDAGDESAGLPRQLESDQEMAEKMGVGGFARAMERGSESAGLPRQLESDQEMAEKIEQERYLSEKRPDENPPVNRAGAGGIAMGGIRIPAAGGGGGGGGGGANNPLGPFGLGFAADGSGEALTPYDMTDARDFNSPGDEAARKRRDALIDSIGSSIWQYST